MAGPLSEEGWKRNVWTLTLIVFIAYVGFQFSGPFLPLYIHQLGVEDPRRVAMWAGLCAAVTPAVSGILGPWFGRLADRFGRKMMIIRSLGGFVIIIALMGMVTSVEQFFVARLVQGLFAGFTPMVMALASVSAPKDRVPVAIGMVQSAQIMSVAIGPAVGGWVASHWGIPYAFFATAALCAVALVVLIVLFREVEPGTRVTGKTVPRLPLRDVFRYPHFPVVIAMLMVAQFLDRGLSLLIPLEVAHLVELDRVALISGVIISIAAVAATLSANLVARLSHGVPPARLLLLGLLIGGPLCAAMALAKHWPTLLVLRALVGFCLGSALTLAYSLGAQIVPGENRGAAFGWLALGVQVGTALSPLVTGGLAAVSLPGTFVFDGVLAVAAGALLAFGARGLRARQAAGGAG